MSKISLSQKEKDQIVSISHPFPRSVLGFHEVEASNGNKSWLIRVMEPDAQEVKVFWDSQDEDKAISLEKIHPKGLFEITMPPLPQFQPYRLKIRYKDGNEHVRYDPYYFSPQFTDYDRFLFGQGNHHQIYRKLGAHLIESEGVQGTLFAVWAPNATRVSVVGEFNQWNGQKHPMQIHPDAGVWEVFIPEVKDGTIYKYEIKTHSGDILLKTDPYGFAMEHRPATASIVSDIEGFEWKDEKWMKERAEKNAIQQPINIYEVHLGSWKRMDHEDKEEYPDGRFLTYQEAELSLIPYAKEMGYTHIEMLPISEHPLDASWGYQVTGYFSPSSRHGSPKDFMHFVDACHEAGLGVILDWVPGHFPKDAYGLAQFDGTHLYEHQDDRIGEHKEWGTLTFNYGRTEVKNFLVANALFWFEYYHIDGIRVDAVASMLYLDYNRDDGQWVANKYGGNEHIEAIEFLRYLNSTLFEYYPGILSIAEESTAWPGVSHPAYTGGLGFNLKWNMGWMNDTLRYIELDPVYRKYDHHLASFSLTYAYSENYVLPISHDEVVHGKRSLLDKMPGDLWQKQANYRAYLTFQMAHPGKKLLFMGSEFGQWREWSEARSLDWHLLEHGEHQSTKNFCKTINWFYRNHPAMFTEDFTHHGFEWIDHHDSQNSVFSFIRKDTSDKPEEPLLFIFNFTPVPREDYKVGVPQAGSYTKLLDTDSFEFSGSGFNRQASMDSEPGNWQGRSSFIHVELPPLGALILQRTKK